MNPHASHSISPQALSGSMWRNRSLIFQMAKRDVIGRYRGSMAGLLWSLLTPLLMLAMYTFVFSIVFKARWGGAEESKILFAVVLFVGMIIHGFFAEVLNRSSNLIVENVSYVKKVVFPLEILPLITMGAALFQIVVSMLVLLLVFVLFTGHLYWTVIFFPLVILPLIMLTLGLAWILASIGVYFRDVGHTTGLLTTVLMFFSPVFYPASALPKEFRHWIMVNPISFPIEQARTILIEGRFPNWIGLSIYSVVAVFVAWLGFAWFQKTRKGFADVL